MAEEIEQSTGVCPDAPSFGWEQPAAWEPHWRGERRSALPLTERAADPRRRVRRHLHGAGRHVVLHRGLSHQPADPVALPRRTDGAEGAAPEAVRSGSPTSPRACWRWPPSPSRSHSSASRPGRGARTHPRATCPGWPWWPWWRRPLQAWPAPSSPGSRYSSPAWSTQARRPRTSAGPRPARGGRERRCPGTPS